MPERAALVTGVAGEIGAYLTDILLEDGWLVRGLDVKTPARTERERFAFLQCDLSDAAQTEKQVDAHHQGIGAFDLVINCAGLIANSPLISFVDGKLVHHDAGLWDRVIGSCLSSTFYVSAPCVARMVGAGKRGVIINISSVCARGNAGQAAYSAAKAGVNGLTAAMAKELGPTGIRVVAIAPGYFDTASTREHVAEAKLKETRNAVPLKRLGKLEEVGSAVRFVIGNGYFNGRVLELDGGLVL